MCVCFFFCVRVCLCRVFIPNYISKVKVQLVNCSTKNKSSESCPVVLKIRARAPPVHNSSALDCREWNPCELDTLVPAWEQWYYILVERYLTNCNVYFRIGVQITGEFVFRETGLMSLQSFFLFIYFYLFLACSEFQLPQSSICFVFIKHSSSVHSRIFQCTGIPACLNVKITCNVLFISPMRRQFCKWEYFTNFAN